MKPEFHEDYAEEHVAPEATESVDFDWDALYQSLGEAPEQRAEQFEDLATVIRKIFEFCIEVDLTAKNAKVLVARRFLAFVWVTNPDLFQDNRSLRKLSRSLGMSAYPLARLTAEVTRQFGITNPRQNHAWNRK